MFYCSSGMKISDTENSIDKTFSRNLKKNTSYNKHQTIGALHKIKQNKQFYNLINNKTLPD
jgi:hypothetical protein